MEYPQHNETNSTILGAHKNLDLQAVQRALMVLRENAISILDTVEKDFYDFYSTDVSVIKFVDKEIMKKIFQFKQDIKNIVVYSKHLEEMNQSQGRLFYD